MYFSVCNFNSIFASYFAVERYLIMAPSRAETCRGLTTDNLGVLPLKAVFDVFDFCDIPIFLK